MAFHEAVGTHLGVSAVDQRALAFIAREGPTAAGAVAREIGLTPGAVTGMVDRLERARLVRREPDPADRRRVLITAIPGGTGQVADAFAELGTAMNAVMGRYDECGSSRTTCCAPSRCCASRPGSSRLASQVCEGVERTPTRARGPTPPWRVRGRARQRR
ncbi:MarR family winged helix-turn-helix transcriptional regulator [Amycolatopsis marina]|uniref:MarR family winged helix-turn-helix transcriptional regulator n=1 Tax=Amycolatopsis marina TaxID=490629 RepID=UPI000A6CB115|nr:MarR family transcriptional regulator [Amycolatopsis marina]